MRRGLELSEYLLVLIVGRFVCRRTWTLISDSSTVLVTLSLSMGKQINMHY